MSLSQEFRSVLWPSSSGLREHSIWANNVHDDEMPNEKFPGRQRLSQWLPTISPPIQSSEYLSSCPSIHQYTSVSRSECLSISTYLPTYLPLCPSVRPSIHPSTLSMCPCTSMTLHTNETHRLPFSCYCIL